MNFVSLRFVSICFVVFVLNCFVSFRFVSVSFCTLQGPALLPHFSCPAQLVQQHYLIVTVSSRYAAYSSISWSTSSILVLSNVLFLYQISVTFVSCTQRSRLTFVTYSCVFVSRYSCVYRYLLNPYHVRGWFAFGSSECSGAFLSNSQLPRGTVFSNFIWQ